MARVIVVVVVVFILLLVWRAATSRDAVGADPRGEIEDGAVWEATHYGTSRSLTRVVVRLGRRAGPADERTIAEIADSDPDYDAKFTDAMAQARARAAMLNVEDGRR